MDLYWWLQAFCTYLLCVFLLFVIPAAANIPLGYRDGFVNLLLKVFQFGYKRIERENELNEAASEIIDHNTIKQEVDRRRRSSVVQMTRTAKKSIHTLFRLDSICELTTSGVEAIIEDTVTKRFTVEELPSWNLLHRTNLKYQFISVRLTVIWLLGWFVRYFIFLPVRTTLIVCSLGLMLVSVAVVPHIPDEKIRDKTAKWAMIIAFRIFARGVSAVVHYHNRENMARGGGICVANHTTPLDAILLSCDRNYSFIGQKQGSLFGMMQRALSESFDHLFFERSEMKDRLLVVKRMKEHTEDPEKNPILIFPEGTCINNTSVMMFRKGAFEVEGAVIYPVAIKYNPIFGNAFWNSLKEPFLIYILNMLTSWAIVCDIWYMPPVVKEEGESAIEFANRVKRSIAAQGGLVDLVWDGALKRAAVPPRLKEKQQQDIARRLKEEYPTSLKEE